MFNAKNYNREICCSNISNYINPPSIRLSPQKLKWWITVIQQGFWESMWICSIFTHKRLAAAIFDLVRVGKLLLQQNSNINIRN